MSRGGRPGKGGAWRGGGAAKRGPARPSGNGKGGAPAGPRLGAGQVGVNGYSEQWLRQGFPWVYPQEVTGGLGAPGAEVQLVGPSGAVLGRGITDGGWLAARVFRHDDGALDAAWMRERVGEALALRDAVIEDGTTCCRLIHGENDGLPGIRVDDWAGHLVVTLDSPAVGGLVAPLLDAIAALRVVHSAHLCYRPDPRETLDPGAFSPPPGVLRGSDPGEVVVAERGVRLAVHPAQGPDVGAYMDMREVRRFLQPYWRGRRVLNTFAYTGAFSVAALAAGAAEAVSVDLSRPYLDGLRRNLELNGLSVADDAILEEDVFKALDRLRRTGRRFDAVVLDPPGFSHGPGGTWSAGQDYPRLVAGAARVLDPGGWLVAALNVGRIAPRAFRGMVSDGLKKAGRGAREVAFLGAAPDFPAAVSFPEGHYLKVGVWVLS